MIWIFLSPARKIRVVGQQAREIASTYGSFRGCMASHKCICRGRYRKNDKNPGTRFGIHPQSGLEEPYVEYGVTKGFCHTYLDDKPP